ncbi:unnamed protein product [Ectocarpus sp. 13 AM-2016]
MTIIGFSSFFLIDRPPRNSSSRLRHPPSHAHTWRAATHFGGSDRAASTQRLFSCKTHTHTHNRPVKTNRDHNSPHPSILLSPPPPCTKSPPRAERKSSPVHEKSRSNGRTPA